MKSHRRTFLKVLGGSATTAVFTASPLFRAIADQCSAEQVVTEFFIFIHAAGGWDVTLWSDPRNERVTDSRGQVQVEPASSDNTDTSGIRLWQDAPLDAGVTTFRMVHPTGHPDIDLGPGVGGMINHFDRACLINGVNMATVSHPDGTYFSSTGRHLAGGRPVASSIDTMVANSLGVPNAISHDPGQLFPNISINYPSSFIGELDPRATPLRVSTVGTVATSLTRSGSFEQESDREAVTDLLKLEATDLAHRAYHPDAFNAMALQYGSLQQMISQNLTDVFSATRLGTAYPQFVTNSYDPMGGRYRLQNANAINFAFAVEAMSRNVIRCASFTLTGYDTHNTNYQNQAAIQQEGFDLIATLIDTLSTTDHPCLVGQKLIDHTHILVTSDFSRTPNITLSGGRDHQPNNTCMIVSPKFKSLTTMGRAFGDTDAAQLLPNDYHQFAGESAPRPAAPPDVLATFIHGVGIDPTPYSTNSLRDGAVIPDVLVTG